MLASNDDSDADERLNFSFAADIVELVVLTADEPFLQTLRQAVGDTRRLWHVPSADQVGDLLLAGQVGILVLDVHALAEDAGVFITQLKRQFPDLVLVVAGAHDVENTLAPLISSGIVYRFIHKPMSPGRAKLFADAAVKKYAEQRKRPPARPPSQRSEPRMHWLLLGGAAVLAAGVATWAVRRPPAAAPPAGAPAALQTAPTDAGEAPLLARADAALSANRLTDPAGEGALELYRQAVARSPADPAARRGLENVLERLWARAQNALLEERLDEAAAAIETARMAGVEGSRIALLKSQLARARLRQKGMAAATRAREDAHAAALDPVTDRVTQYLSLAEERLKQGRLADPPEDNARFYVQQALQLDPNGNAVDAARQSLAIALLAAVRAAIDQHEWQRATQLLDAASGMAAEANLENSRQLLAAARQRAADETPDPTAPAPAGAPTTAVAAGAPAPAPAPTVTAASAAGSNAAAAATSIVPAGTLTLLESTKPAYPRQAAAAGTEGWVELDFTVGENGAVRDVSVRAANPPGVFDAAARAALAQWRYQPVLRDAQPTAQRSRIRIRFTLSP